MADSDFGDFSSAFPPTSNPEGPPFTSISLEIGNQGQPIQESGNFFAAFPLQQPGDTCPNVFAPPLDLDPDGTFSFDAFATCPVNELNSDGSNAEGFVDFSQFNIADVPISNMADINFEKGIFEIPPLPEELIPERETDEKSKTGLSQAGQVDTKPGLSSSHHGAHNLADFNIEKGIFEIPPLPEELIPERETDEKSKTGLSQAGQQNLQVDAKPGASTFANHTSGSFHAFSLSKNAVNNAGAGSLSDVPAPMASTSRNGPITHKSSRPLGTPTDVRTTQPGTGALVVATSVDSDSKQNHTGGRDDDDVFGDFESSFEQALPTSIPLGVTATTAVATTIQGALSDSHSTQADNLEPVPGLRTSELHNGNLKPGSQRSKEFTNLDTSENSLRSSQRDDNFAASGDESEEPKAQQEAQDDSFGSFTASRTDSSPQNSNAGNSTTAFPSTEEPLRKTSLQGDTDRGQSGISPSLAQELTQTASNGKSLQTEFGSFATGASRVDIKNTESEGGFSGFQAFASTTTSSEGKADEFGDFGNFQSPAGVDFGAFSSSNTTKDTEFGEFGTLQESSVNTQAQEFGAFSGDTSARPPVTTGSGRAVREALATTSTASAQTKGNTVKLTGDVLVVCFPSRATDLYPQATRSRLMSHLVMGTDQSSMWQSLQRCIDFTVPLYKWDKSYVQEHYQGALKIDPMLVSGPGVLPVFASGPFDIPLEGQSAAEDLMESFGFETELEPVQVPHPPRGNKVKEEERAAPALLDLSLPSTPAADTQRDPFSEGLAADLLGLDLSGPQQQQSKQLTSIQELLLNERLVVNRSTWKDSKLLEYESAPTPPSANSSNTPTPLLPRKESSINVEQQLLQLGLDASKTTFSTVPAQQTELSFSARTVLGRLPDLSFMLSDGIQST